MAAQLDPIRERKIGRSRLAWGDKRIDTRLIEANFTQAQLNPTLGRFRLLLPRTISKARKFRVVHYEVVLDIAGLATPDDLWGTFSIEFDEPSCRRETFAPVMDPTGPGVAIHNDNEFAVERTHTSFLEPQGAPFLQIFRPTDDAGRWTQIEFTLTDSQFQALSITVRDRNHNAVIPVNVRLVLEVDYEADYFYITATAPGSGLPAQVSSVILANDDV